MDNVTVLTAAATVTVGVIFELSYLLWIYAADRGWPFRTALVSMFVGAVSLFGMSAAIRDPWQAPWLILGYGIGSYVAALWKRRQAAGQSATNSRGPG